MGNLTALKEEASSVLSDAEFAISAGESYVSDLHGKASDLAEENRKVQELAYGNWLQNLASSEDWFNLHVMIIPCIYVRWFLFSSKAVLSKKQFANGENQGVDEACRQAARGPNN